MTATSELFAELGIEPIINAHGHPTTIGGNNPSTAVKAAMEDVSGQYVKMSELVEVTGERIAEMLGVPAAMVTPGCASALALGAAACITRNHPDRMEQIPDTTGMPNEFIIQRQLRVIYDKALTIPGGVLVEVGDDDGTTEAHIEAAITERTAGIHYLAGGLYDDPDERETRTDIVPFRRLVELAHSHDLPLIVDAAGQVYPTERLSLYARGGADLVGYGGKYFEGLNTSGLLLGANEELVHMAYRHSFIGFEYEQARMFGRSMKMDRQTVIATYVALREWLTTDHEARLTGYEARLDAHVRPVLTPIPGVTVSDFPSRGLLEGLRVTIDASVAGMSAAELEHQLAEGSPRIHVRADEVPDSFIIRIQTVDEGDEKIIAERIRQIISG
jgi:D-glucosaminate-6-phosphate ammonia-lyase